MRKRKNIVAVLLLIAVLCSGCALIEKAPPAFTVAFYDGETEQLASQSVVQDGLPAWFGAKKDGCVLTGWADASGAAASPFSTPVTQETRYYAQWRPVLGGHAPYLFPDERGFLRPEDIMTREELGAAVRALVAEAAMPYLPELPAGEESVNGETLASVTELFFPGSGAALAQRGALTRAEVAVILNGLLGRTDTELVELLPGALLPPDIGAARTDRARLLEACIPHEAEGFATWENISVPALLPPGFVHFGSELYYVDKSGSFLQNAALGTLQFDAQGKYTSGDAVLDGHITEILAGLMQENPEADRLELLRAAYLYTRDSFTYLRRNAYAFRATGWEISDAVNMIESGRGNCYCYAAVFWALARQLGYDARAISGTVTETSQPHGWVEIDIDGETYYFDPELEMTYVEKKQNVPDMFMMTYARSRGWSYRE